MTISSLVAWTCFAVWFAIVSVIHTHFPEVSLSACAFHLDTSSFVLNLKTRRDRGFHVHKELCQYLQKLARRCVRPSSLPSESDYHDILRISIPDSRALSVDDFVSRSKLTPRLDVCCKRKAEKERKDAKNSSLSLDQLVANNREEFSRQARAYVAHLFGAAAGLTRFTSDIVKGLGAFDLETLLIDTMEQAAYCFKNLFSSFRLRGVFKSEEESLYMEEYLSFIDEVRRSHPEMQQPKLLIADAIDFVSKQPALKPRVYLPESFASVAFVSTSLVTLSFQSGLAPPRLMTLLVCCLMLLHPYSPI